MFENTFGYEQPPISGLRREVDRLFADFFRDSYAPARTGIFPPVNSWEDEHNYYLEAELPGLTMEEVELYVSGNELVLKGSRGEGARKAKVMHRRERGTGKFHRAVLFPAEIDGDAVSARLKDGVLSVSLPKAESAKPRRIAVKSQ